VTPETTSATPETETTSFPAVETNVAAAIDDGAGDGVGDAQAASESTTQSSPVAPAAQPAEKSDAPRVGTPVAAVTVDEFFAANADWVYFRYLPPREQVEAVHRSKKRAFIAGPTVAGDLPENWRLAVGAGIDAILTDYPLNLRHSLKQAARNHGATP
jgi:hypothetical protein